MKRPTVLDYAGKRSRPHEEGPAPRLAAGLSLGCALLFVAYTAGWFGKHPEALFAIVGAGITASVVGVVQSCLHPSGSGLWLAVWGLLLNLAAASLVAYLMISD
jgi:hypothetical protein